MLLRGFRLRAKPRHHPGIKYPQCRGIIHDTYQEGREELIHWDCRIHGGLGLSGFAKASCSREGDV